MHVSILQLKQFLVHSQLASVALDLRAFCARVVAPAELAGTVANDGMSELILTRLCAPGRIFLDVGAHIGSITGRVAQHCPQSRIEAFEPIPHKATRLSQKFPQVTVHCCALSDTEGYATFHVNLDHSGLSSLAKTSAAVEEIQVPLRTLDAIVDSGDVDVIKIDVEGAELGVLRGASRLIGRSRPIVMFESGPKDVLGYTKPELWQYFQVREYGIFVPNRIAHRAPPLGLDCFLESHQYPSRTTNYFAIPFERTEEVRGRTRKILKLGAV